MVHAGAAVPAPPPPDAQLAAQGSTVAALPAGQGWIAAHTAAVAGILLACAVAAAALGLVLCLCCNRMRQVSLKQGAILDTERGLRASAGSSASRSSAAPSSHSMLQGHYFRSSSGTDSSGNRACDGLCNMLPPHRTCLAAALGLRATEVPWAMILALCNKLQAAATGSA